VVPNAMFTPTNSLERLLVEAASKPERRGEFNRALLSARVYVLGTASSQSSGGAKVGLYGISVEGRRVIPAFTSVTRLQEYIKTPQPYVGLVGRDFLELMEPDVGVVLNPASACGKEFFPWEIEKLLTMPPLGPDRARES